MKHRAFMVSIFSEHQGELIGFFSSPQVKELCTNDIRACRKRQPVFIQPFPVPATGDSEQSIPDQEPDRPSFCIENGKVDHITAFGYVIGHSGYIIPSVIVRREHGGMHLKGIIRNACRSEL